mgnify:CR=1 FL=1
MCQVEVLEVDRVWDLLSPFPSVCNLPVQVVPETSPVRIDSVSPVFLARNLEEINAEEERKRREEEELQRELETMLDSRKISDKKELTYCLIELNEEQQV